MALVKIQLTLLFLSFIASPLKAQVEDLKVNAIGYGYYNAFLLSANGKHLMIDSGVEGKEEKIIKKIKHLGVDPQDISLLIITHVHGDHVGGAAFFQKHYNIPVMVHTKETAIAESGRIAELKVGTQKKKLAEWVKKRAHDEFPAFTPDILLEEDTLGLEQYGFPGKIFFVGGHSSGSIVLAIGEHIFAGDLLRGGLLCRKRPAYHFFAHNQKVLANTLNGLMKQPYQTYYVGHGGPLKKQAIEKFLKKNPLPDVANQ
ncbi:MAG: MBL fold metallo-hydrolase [Thermonemataceae bacterium]